VPDQRDTGLDDTAERDELSAKRREARAAAAL
jgi:hypothetical protein